MPYITFEQAYNNGDIILPETVDLPSDYASDLLSRSFAEDGTDKLLTIILANIRDGEHGDKTIRELVEACYSNEVCREIIETDEINYECARLDQARKDFAEDAAEWAAQ
ncbi:hypothetical protein [Wielerella bovis]|uniref:hypothetical protein n=1 Tax=Wielerella bovis TaxID=2917790 RepID=UPI0020187DED|nr:hypothetical protein [Wielerella bovis]ULJ66201.1 hypothetical protein MIS31_07945 [Wielerella bovis]ULJ66636.1 hypothetical protein MIS31_10365 [Wielerella bovis]